MPGKPHHVLLTGATGFLGTYLLHELFVRTGASVTCLVRATDGESALRRVIDTQREAGLWDERHAGRLSAVRGDLAKPFLGLAEDVYRELAGSVDTIFHSGGKVNWNCLTRPSTTSMWRVPRRS